MDGIAELLKDRPPAVVSLCERLLAALKQFDDVRIEVSPKVVVLHGGSRILGSVRPTRQGLNVHLNLPHRVEDRRVTRSEPLTKRLTFHRFMLSSPDDLDEQFTTWIDEAHDAARSGR
jgi:Domain of unknown function (DUF5655)